RMYPRLSVRHPVSHAGCGSGLGPGGSMGVGSGSGSSGDGPGGRWNGCRGSHRVALPVSTASALLGLPALEQLPPTSHRDLDVELPGRRPDSPPGAITVCVADI